MNRLYLLATFALGLAVAAGSAVPSKTFTLDPGTIARSFSPFSDSVDVRWDKDYFYAESNSMPDHRMMVGIRAWNQQVPIPQPYSGDNAFRLPLRARFADSPVSGKETLFRGAIAVAVNGIPIFNPIKQDGRTDTNLAGELDEFGGHAGRADDYHYHLAPVHLAERGGQGLPVAWALDGFPIYSYREADGSSAEDLDWLNGHTGPDGMYHYHATREYPYLNGGFRGSVELRNGEVAIQPRARGVRPYTRPLRGATITGFEVRDASNYRLQYELGEKTHSIQYSLQTEGGAEFVFIDGEGRATTEVYEPRSGRGDGPGNRRREPRGSGRAGPPRADGRRGPDPNDPNRRPWLIVHFQELDANGDGDLSHAELSADVESTFAGYDRDGNGELTRDEYENGRSRTALAGFVRQHAVEIDRSNDSKLSKDEVVEVAERMFRRADRNADGKVDAEESRVP